MQYLLVYSAGKVWDQREEKNYVAVNIVHWLKILNTTKIYLKKRKKKQHTHTRHPSSLISALLVAVKGPADVSALFMQIPFCSSVTMEYCSLFLTLASLPTLRLFTLHLKNCFCPLFVQGKYQKALFPPLLTVFCKNIQNTWPSATNCTI